MEMEYVQDQNRTYLLLKAEETADSGFEENMMKQNEIKGILPFHVKETNGKKEYYFDVTGKKSLIAAAEEQNMEGGQLCRMLFSVYHTMERAAEYLLEPRRLVLSPECLYTTDGQMEKLYVCYLPGKEGGLMDGIQELLRFALTKIDHEDQETTALGYELYRLSAEENQSMEPLLEKAGAFLEEQAEKQEQEEKKLAEEEQAPGAERHIWEKGKVFLYIKRKLGGRMV